MIEGMSKIVTWNTGRQYSPKGQRIAAATYNDRLFFVDVDRGIEGLLYLPVDGLSSYDVKRWTMDVYDTCNYSSPRPHDRDVINELTKAAEALS